MDIYLADGLRCWKHQVVAWWGFWDLALMSCSFTQNLSLFERLFDSLQICQHTVQTVMCVCVRERDLCVCPPSSLLHFSPGRTMCPAALQIGFWRLLTWIPSNPICSRHFIQKKACLCLLCILSLMPQEVHCSATVAPLITTFLHFNLVLLFFSPS